MAYSLSQSLQEAGHVFFVISRFMLIPLLVFSSCYAQEQDSGSERKAFEEALFNHGQVAFMDENSERCWVSLETNSSHFLISPGLVGHLELTDYQEERLTESRRVAANAISQQLATSPNRSKVIDEAKKVTKKYENDIQAILLPHQKELIGRFPTYIALRNFGVTNMLASDGFPNIKLSNDQKNALVSTAKELAGEFEKKIERLERETMTKLLSDLSSEEKDSVMEYYELLIIRGASPRVLHIQKQLETSKANCCGQTATVQEGIKIDLPTHLKSVLESAVEK